jgi:hypothetical protein
LQQVFSQDAVLTIPMPASVLHERECFVLALQKEASDVFFAATKLFQAKDPHLRRMVYLLIKVLQLAAFP